MKYYKLTHNSCSPRTSEDSGRLPTSTLFGNAFGIFIISLIIIVPNAAAAGASYAHIFGSVNPSSSIASALHASYAAWLAFQIFLALTLIAAAVVDILALALFISSKCQNICLLLLAVAVGVTPVWVPYAVDAILRQNAYNHACDGFDGTVYLNAVHSNGAGVSVAVFPAAFGGAKWQLYQSAADIYDFAPVGQSSKLSINLNNDTYVSGTNGSFTDDPLSFPEFGLTSSGSWIRSCFAPAVSLQESNGTVVVKTGLTAYSDCSQLEVCASKGAGDDAVFVAVARILIALENAASCCARYRYH